jgi:asparagine synthase (glutamine-hydrolysing)
MCGICGIVSLDGAPRRGEELRPMLSALAHRGPDGEGIWTDAGATLGHRRLSIIDLQGGAQPMANEDGSVVVTFNGEIYNHREIRERLAGKGHQFKTRSDTEALIHLYEDEGAAMVGRLRGMFAFAIWDANRRRLFCARDRLGEKPLFYSVSGGRLVFASEIKAILALGGAAFTVDREAIDSYLAVLHTVGERTAVREIARLAPGHTLLLENGAVRTAAYWRPPLGAHEDRTPEQWVELVRAATDRAVSRQLEADVPLGVFLSGGWDSSTVAAAAARHGSAPLRTFSIGFGQRDDETPFARAMANHVGANHTELHSGWKLEETLARLQRIYDEPFADSAAVPMLDLCREASRHVKVVLGGDGGDEIFGGYGRYLDARALMQPAANTTFDLRRRLARASARASRWPLFRRLRRFEERRPSVDFSNRYLAIFGQPYCGAGLRKRLLGWGLGPNDPTPHERLLLGRYDRLGAGFDDGDWCAAYDLGAYLPDDLLVKVDIAAMACGLELRSPLLDHELVELALSMPSAVRLPDGQLKGLFKKAVGDWLAPEVRSRTEKKGLGAPVAVWLADPTVKRLTGELLLAGDSPLHGLLDMEQVRAVHRRGAGRNWTDNYRVWQLLCLALWRIAYPEISA